MNIIQRVVRHFLFKLQKIGLFNKIGLYIMPKHYYYPIPEMDKIKEDPFWDVKPKELPGIDLNKDYQLNLLQIEFPKYTNEYDFPLEKHDSEEENAFYFNNHMFANTDAEVYYCMLRHFKPRKIIEVGAGRSTQICCEAVRKNNKEDGIKAEIFVIEPYPNKIIINPLKKNLNRIVETKVQELNHDFFQQLNENDILFIDSSHVIKSAGDVNYLFLEVLPRLHPGVLVHIHDIRIPYEVPKLFIIEQSRFFTEQYLLQAFLIGNDDFQILWGTYFMTKMFPEKIASVFRSSGGGTYAGGSFWIRRKFR